MSSGMPATQRPPSTPAMQVRGDGADGHAKAMAARTSRMAKAIGIAPIKPE